MSPSLARHFEIVNKEKIFILLVSKDFQLLIHNAVSFCIQTALLVDTIVPELNAGWVESQVMVAWQLVPLVNNAQLSHLYPGGRVSEVALVTLHGAGITRPAVPLDEKAPCLGMLLRPLVAFSSHPCWQGRV